MDSPLLQHKPVSQWERSAAAMSLGTILVCPIVIVAATTHQSRSEPVLVQAPELDAQSRARLLIHPPGYIDAGDFSFGYLEYEGSQRAANGIPVFEQWPSRGQSRP